MAHGQPRSLGKFFRDRDDAGASSDLSTEIRTAVAGSEHLIVICSPASAQSRYVEAEIRDFDAINRTRSAPGQILALIVAGEPNASEPRFECFTPALRGGLLNVSGKPFEPLAADARPTGDGRARALAKLASGLTGLRYDALVRRDLQRQRRNRNLALAACLVFLTIAAVTGWQIVSDRNARQLAEQERSLVATISKAEKSLDHLEAGNRRMAAKLAVESLDARPGEEVLPQTYRALYAVLTSGGKPIHFEIADNIPTNWGGGRHWSVGDGRTLSSDENGFASIWSIDEGILSRRNDLATGANKRFAAAPDGSAFYFEGRGSIDVDLRYRPKDQTWDEVRLQGVSFEIMEMGIQETFLRSYHSHAPDLLVGCGGPGVLGMKVAPEGDTEAELLWTIDLKGAMCTSTARAENGDVLVGLWDGTVAVYDDTTRTEKSRMITGSKGWITLIEPRERKVFVRADIREAFVFEAAATQPFLSYAVHPHQVLSDAKAQRVINSRLEEPFGFDIVDVKTHAKVGVSCSCVVYDFDSDGNLLTREPKVASLRSRSTGEVLRVFPELGPKIDRLRYLKYINSVIGERDLMPETILSLTDVPEVRALFELPRDGVSSILSATYGPSSLIDVVKRKRLDQSSHWTFETSQLTEKGDLKTRWQLNVEDHERDAYHSMRSLGSGHVLVFRSLGSGNEVKASLHNTSSNEVLGQWQLADEPDDVTNSGHLVLDAMDGVKLLDVRTGAAVDTGVVAGRSVIRRHLNVDGDNLFILRDQRTLQHFILAPGQPPVPGPDLDYGGLVHALCIAPGASHAFAVVERDGKVKLVRSTLNKEPDTIETIIADTDTAVFQLLSDIAMHDTVTLRQSISCERDTLVLRGNLSDTLRWNLKDRTYATTKRANTKTDWDSFPKAGRFKSAMFKENVLSIRKSRAAATETFVSSFSKISAADYEQTSGLVAAGHENGVLKVWRSGATDEPLIEIKAHEGQVTGVDFSPDGSSLLTFDRNGSIIAWPLFAPSALRVRVTQLTE